MPIRDDLEGPKFVQVLEPVLAALRALGGSARPAEVVDQVARAMQVTDAQRAEALDSGTSRFDNLVHWARFYLVKTGFIDSSRRGVWTLTDKGRTAPPLSYQDALRLIRQQHAQFADERAEARAHADSASDETAAPVSADAPPSDDHRENVLSTLRSLPAAGFERFCQRLLRESGFQEVAITGRSGDGGIDGIGILQVNPLVSFKVLFQCKRYGGTTQVTPSQIRDFRGAMSGRADKGIVITTGTFTAEAKREAVRDGVPPIELVDRDKLVSMLEELELGLKPVQTFAIDHDFFDDFRDVP